MQQESSLEFSLNGRRGRGATVRGGICGGQVGVKVERGRRRGDLKQEENDC